MNTQKWLSGIVCVAWLWCGWLSFAQASVFEKPAFSVDWLHAMRWDNRLGYHPGTKEYFQPRVSGACVIVGSHLGQLTCRDRQYGFQRWEINLNHPLVPGVVLHDGYGYGVSQDGVLFKFGVHTGTVFWTENLKKGFVVPPVYHDGALFLQTIGGEVLKYNLEKRDIVWRYRNTLNPTTTLMGGSSITIHPDGFIVVGLTAGRVVALEIDSGKQRWMIQLPVGQKVEDVDAPITVLTKGLMLISSAYSMTYVIQSSGKGFQSWSFGSPRGAVSFPYKGKLYVIQGDFNQLRYLGPSSGSVENIHVGKDLGYALTPQLIKPPYVVIAFSKGSVMLLDAEKQSYVWIRDAHGDGPGFSANPTVTADGELFLFSNYSNLVKIDLDLAKLSRQL